MYSLLIILLSPALFFYTFYRATRDGGIKYLLQRLGFGYPQFVEKPVWFHCASVGELNAALPLLQAIESQYPRQQILLSTNTPTAAYVLQKLPLKNTVHTFLPLDFQFAASRFIKACSPACVLILETELWPNLFRICKQRRVPLNIINGRLSHRTLNTKTWIKNIYRETLGFVDNIYARNSEDANAFISLGATASKVKVLGNIKFVPSKTGTRKNSNPIDQGYWLAASTHDPEELICAQIQRAYRSRLPLLVIVPRHPERLNAILQQLAPLALNIAVRSRGENTENADIYLADTFGELQNFLHHTKLTFMGGSLIPHGGQNIIEAAAAGTCIITGPHMFNFAEESKLFLEQEAIFQVANAKQLEKTVLELNSNADKRALSIKAAKNLLSQGEHILKRYLNIVESHLPDKISTPKTS